MNRDKGAVQASLFVTCIIDQIYPEAGESTVRVLRRLGVDLDFPTDQTCCGQPAFNTGYWNEAKPLARRFLDQFQGDRPVVVPSGSCAAMIKVYYEELFHDEPEDLARAQQIAPRVYELSEFIVDIIGIENFAALTGTGSGNVRKVTYHEACHLRRELGVDTQPRALIRQLPGVELVEMHQAEVCCGFGGTFSVKFPEISGAMLADKIKNIRASGADTLTACDSSCLMHLSSGLEKEGLKVSTLHLAEILDQFTSEA